MSSRSSAKGTGPSSRPSGKTQICTSLSRRTCGELADDATLAFAEGTDLVEFRVDLLKDPNAAMDSGELSEFSPRAVFTMRSAKEGGGFGGEESDRLAFIRKLSLMRPAYLDIELSTLDSNPDLGADAHRGRVIVSWHDMAQTPAKGRLRSIMRRARGHRGLVKMVGTAARPADNLSILSLYAEPGATPIAFCMGSAGLFSRVMAIQYCTPLVYASLPGRQTAPGQLSLKSALALRRRLQDD
ncbi:MAG: type I 3-dehydroquinate dehydratase [Thaumarchaeota archaeon]|nr:type I 3-dehydroquinate dehydratase [Nitrososphaerota archaeon]